MGDKIDMSLDDIIKINKVTGGKKRGGKSFGGGAQRGLKRLGGRGGFNSNNRTGGASNNRQGGGFMRSSQFKKTGTGLSGRWQHDLFEGGAKSGGQGGPGHLLVTNLDFRVSDADIQELFAEFGMLRKAAVHYDKSGRSLGTADVIYENRNNAVTAMQKYNGVPLDGRAMKIVMVNGKNADGGNTQINRGIGKRLGQKRPGRGGFGGGNFGGNRRNNNKRQGKNDGPAPTAEELDAELDAYVNKMS